MESQTAYEMLSDLTADGAFTRGQAEKLIRAIELASLSLATREQIIGFRKDIKLRLARLELRIVMQNYAAMGVLFAALKIFG